jgi:hypothetical protein
METIKNHKTELIYFSQSLNLYYCETTNERVKIEYVNTSGLVNVYNKRGFKYQILISEIKRIY